MEGGCCMRLSGQISFVFWTSFLQIALKQSKMKFRTKNPTGQVSCKETINGCLKKIGQMNE